MQAVHPHHPASLFSFLFLSGGLAHSIPLALRGGKMHFGFRVYLGDSQ